MSETVELGKLKINIDESNIQGQYTFTGEVDEHFNHENVPKSAKQKLHFDLEHLDNFNSCGIREWIYLIRELEKNSTIEFHRCSVAMIDNINMVPDSAGKAKILSFFAPYYCNCTGEVNRLIEIKDHREVLKKKAAPDFKCEKCNEPLEFDALEESYFLFIDSHGSDL